MDAANDAFAAPPECTAPDAANAGRALHRDGTHARDAIAHQAAALSMLTMVEVMRGGRWGKGAWMLAARPIGEQVDIFTCGCFATVRPVARGDTGGGSLRDSVHIACR